MFERDIQMNHLLLEARSGGDYNIAKLFIHMFPDCKYYEDRDISIKLSEDVRKCFLEAAKQCSENASNKSISTNHYDIIDDYMKIAHKLLSHSEKHRFIQEIKMIR